MTESHVHDWQPCDVVSPDSEDENDTHPGVECDGCETVYDLVYQDDPR